MSIEHTTIAGEPDAIEASGDEQQEWRDRYAGAMVVGIALVVVALTSVLTVRWFGGLDLITPVGNGVTATSAKPGAMIVGTRSSPDGPWDSGFASDPESIDDPVHHARGRGELRGRRHRAAALHRRGPGWRADRSRSTWLRAARRGARSPPGGHGRWAPQPPDEIVVVITARKPGRRADRRVPRRLPLGPRSAVVDAGIDVRVHRRRPATSSPRPTTRSADVLTVRRTVRRTYSGGSARPVSAWQS